VNTKQGRDGAVAHWVFPVNRIKLDILLSRGKNGGPE
jgi:hypothetical protein